MRISSLDSTRIDPELQIIIGSSTGSTSFVDQYDTSWIKAHRSKALGLFGFPFSDSDLHPVAIALRNAPVIGACMWRPKKSLGSPSKSSKKTDRAAQGIVNRSLKHKTHTLVLPFEAMESWNSQLQCWEVEIRLISISSFWTRNRSRGRLPIVPATTALLPLAGLGFNPQPWWLRLLRWKPPDRCWFLSLSCSLRPWLDRNSGTLENVCCLKPTLRSINIALDESCTIMCFKEPSNYFKKKFSRYLNLILPFSLWISCVSVVLWLQSMVDPTNQRRRPLRDLSGIFVQNEARGLLDKVLGDSERTGSLGSLGALGSIWLGMENHLVI